MAINVRELRIGSIIYYDGDTEVGEDVIVAEIKEEEIFAYSLSCYLNGCERCYHIKKSSYFEPIKLGEEWLNKFGFKERHPHICWVSMGPEDSFEIQNTPNGYFLAIESFEYIVGKPINYIHQLQNIYFALIGEELEIKEL